jgi:hypothetical protein
MTHGWVKRIELNKDDTISLYFTVSGFNAGVPIEISGEASQTNGAVATFYNVRTMPSGAGSDEEIDVGPIPTVGEFVKSDPITVVARASYVWVTSLRVGATSPASVAAGWVAPSNGSYKAEWTWTSEGVALSPPGQAAPSGTPAS